MVKRTISPTCEVLTRMPQDFTTHCGAPTAWWYPAMGGGTMALCEEHAKPHSRYVEPYNAPTEHAHAD